MPILLPPVKRSTDIEDEENPQEPEEENKRKTAMLLFSFLIVIVIFISIPLFGAVPGFMGSSQHDKVFTERNIQFYVNGNDNLTINGWELISPSGKIKYEVALPSHYISWTSVHYLREILAEVDIGEGEPLVRTKRNFRDCQGEEGTWCLTITTSKKIIYPIIVDYLMIFSKTDRNWFPLKRTFYVENWETRRI